MTAIIYTAVTFAPVQGFIEKSRKLRDLYGSSFILSYLAESICKEAEARNLSVVSPALVNVTQGTPNQIVIEGNFKRKDAETVFNQAWQKVTKQCREWIEQNVTNCGEYCWRREWNLWTNYAWEFFWAQGKGIPAAREAMNEVKRSRNWTAVNWTGESSTLSGADAIAYPSMGIVNPQQWNYKTEKDIIENFYKQLSQKVGKAFATHTLKRRSSDEDSNKFGEAIIAPDEELSIPELVKRLITLEVIATKLNIPSNELPQTFRDVNRFEEESCTGWFQGDGDGAGNYLQELAEDSKNEAEALNSFSQAMRNWGNHLPNHLSQGRVVYAGGDDFSGIFYRPQKSDDEGSIPTQSMLQPQDCLNWFYDFPHIWQTHGQPITASIGFVWAAPNVPQRDVLQHCKKAEQSAKRNGRDRLAIRILFNGGNFLEWLCPWWFLPVLQDYQDRDKGKNWGHIYEDVAVLESRHAFQDNREVALALFEVYFGLCHRATLEDNQWNNQDPKQTGILGERTNHPTPKNKIEALNNWVINLAKVGFHLHQ